MSASLDDASVAPLVRKTAAWAWRFLVILAAMVALLWVLNKFEVIVVPVLLALMLSALLVPPVDWLDSRGLPHAVAVTLVLLSGFAVLGGILTFVVSQFIAGLPHLVTEVERSIDSARRWLIEGPAHLRGEQIDNAGNAGDRGAAQQPGEADQWRIVDCSHHYRAGYRGGAGTVHAHFLPLRGPEHLAVRHEGLPGQRP